MKRLLFVFLVSALCFSCAKPEEQAETAENNEAEILKFRIYGTGADYYDGKISQEKSEIMISLPPEMSSVQAPEITVSEGARVTPLSGQKQDFSSPAVYTVISEDGTTTREYVVKLDDYTEPQSGQFYKTKMTESRITVVDMRNDGGLERMVATAFQGLVNQKEAECYLYLSNHHVNQLDDTGRPYSVLPASSGGNPGIKAMFSKYSNRVKNIYLWDPAQDWSWNIALMLAAQNEGLPLTEDMYESLTSFKAWEGNVEKVYDRWPDKKSAYEWAMDNLYPGCHKNLLFSVGTVGDKTLFDYAVASRGFCFWLDDRDPEEASIIDEICRRGNFKPGAVVMGYALGGDDLLKISNKYNLGYVVSDYYANGSFWCSYPNKSFRQRSGIPVKAEPGKIYVSLVFSDGDNVQFDQNALYLIWKDDADKGSFPVGTTLSAGLQELNPFLLEWYYKNMTENDELLGGPSGFQFIYGRDYNETGYESWLEQNRKWLASAGFKTTCLWHTSYGTDKFYRYIETAGVEGIFNGDDDVNLDYHDGVVIMNQGPHLWNEGDLYNNLTAMEKNLDKSKPHFVNLYPIAASYDKYAYMKREASRLNAEFPGRFVFLLPKDNIATARQYYEEHPEDIPWQNK